MSASTNDDPETAPDAEAATAPEAEAADDSARPFIRVRGRSFIALVLSPERPLTDWLAALDEQRRRAATFFDARPVIVDVSAMPDDPAELTTLIDALQERDIRIIGVEGAAPGWTDAETWGRTPMLSLSRPDRTLIVPDDPPAPVPPSPPPESEPAEVPALIIDRPVRSGQTILYERGDVTVLGSVGSGAEVIAGGSIHVYGTLRGRAIAGLLGAGARIFCTRLEAELLAIDGVYKVADDIVPALRGHAVQARLDGDAIILTPLE